MDKEPSTASHPNQLLSRIPNFFVCLSPISALHQRGLLSGDDVQLLSSGNHQVQLNVADKMIENVVGVFGCPWARTIFDQQPGLCCTLGRRGTIHCRRFVWGCSHGATRRRLHRRTRRPHLIGQVQIVIDCDPEQVKQTLRAHREDIVTLANSLHPKMVARGGGALDIEVFDYQAKKMVA